MRKITFRFLFAVVALSLWYVLFQGYRYLYNAYIPWNTATDILSLFIVTVVFIPPVLIVRIDSRNTFEGN
ncbi:hypothetical protein ACF3MZ_23395 [Paenibacillaceae bacterium WGS1546]|uniref:hypothetical protein n=1 Tax=Cohnella sp. WGS1546 TaxID=3366810 RepID=UPI00372D5466